MGSPDVLAGAAAADDPADPAGPRAWGEDERAGVWAVLLPAVPPGPVLLAGLPPATAALLHRRYPNAAYGDAPPGVALLVCTPETYAECAPLLAPGAAVAVVGGRPHRDTVALAPDAAYPISLTLPGRRRGLKNVLAALAGRREGVRITGVRHSLADAVLADAGRAIGRELRLADVLVGSDAVLRATSAAGDVAVVVTLPPASRPDRPDVVAEVRAEVEGVGPWLPDHLADGVTHGCRWRAYAWAGVQARGRTWSARGPGWALAREMAAALGATTTGVTHPGWADRWAARADEFGPAVRATFDRILGALPDGVPTSWCHGDLWAGNVLYDGDGVTLIDWENARRDAPAGLDGILVEAWRRQYTQSRTFGQACADLGAAGAVPDLVVGGRAWAEWNDAERRALVAAAFLLHASNRDVRDLDAEWREANLQPFLGTDAPAPEETTGPSLESRAARGGLWLAAGTVASKGVQMLVLLVLAKLLAPRDLGVLSIGALVVNVAGVIQELGVTDVLTYQATRVRDAARTALTLMLSGSLVVTAICWIGAPYAARFLNAPDGAGVIRGLTIVLPCYAAASVTNALLRRDFDFRRRIVPDVVPAAIGGVVSIALAYLDYGVTALVAGQIVQGLLTPLAAWSVGKRVRPGWDRGLAREIVGYGRHVVGADVLQLALLNIDYTIVARVLGATALGLYSLAFRLCYLPFVNVSYVVNGAAFPYYCRLPSREDLATAVTRVTTALAVTVLPVYVLVGLLATHIEVLGEKWEPTVGPIRALAVYGLLLSFAQGGQTVLRAVGRPDLNLRVRALHVGLLTGTLLLLARHGITVVAIAQAVVAVVVTTVTWLFVRRHIPQLSPRALARQLLPPVAGCAAMAAVVVALRAAGLDDSGSLAVAAADAVAGLVAYAAVVWWLGGERLREAWRVLRVRA